MSQPDAEQHEPGMTRTPDWGSYLLLVALLVLIVIVVVLVLNSTGDVASFFKGG